MVENLFALVGDRQVRLCLPPGRNTKIAASALLRRDRLVSLGPIGFAQFDVHGLALSARIVALTSRL
jgi:hypothetical protein